MFHKVAGDTRGQFQALCRGWYLGLYRRNPVEVLFGDEFHMVGMVSIFDLQFPAENGMSFQFLKHLINSGPVSRDSDRRRRVDTSDHKLALADSCDVFLSHFPG